MNVSCPRQSQLIYCKIIATKKKRVYFHELRKLWMGFPTSRIAGLLLSKTLLRHEDLHSLQKWCRSSFFLYFCKLFYAV